MHSIAVDRGTPSTGDLEAPDMRTKNTSGKGGDATHCWPPQSRLRNTSGQGMLDTLENVLDTRDNDR